MGQIPRSTERISSIDNAIVHERVCVCVCVSVVILKQHIAD